MTKCVHCTRFCSDRATLYSTHRLTRELWGFARTSFSSRDIRGFETTKKTLTSVGHKNFPVCQNTCYHVFYQFLEKKWLLQIWSQNLKNRSR